MLGTVVTGVALTIVILLMWRNIRQLKKIAAEYHDICGKWETEFAKISGVSHNFLNACRLLAIHRNGRVNVFTFARGDQIFTIETMGLLSDNVDEWRNVAGLRPTKGGG